MAKRSGKGSVIARVRRRQVVVPLRKAINRLMGVPQESAETLPVCWPDLMFKPFNVRLVHSVTAEEAGPPPSPEMWSGHPEVVGQVKGSSDTGAMPPVLDRPDGEGK